MKIVGFMVCGPGEADRYLERSLKEFKRLCDDAVIVCNNTDPKTEDLIKSYGYWFYRDDREWGRHQPNIKSKLLEYVGRLSPDWIIALDSDECFSPEFTREEAEKLASTKEIAYYFFVINFYNDEKHYAHDKGIQRFWNVRFYKYLPKLGLGFQNTALHCGLAPSYSYSFGWHAPYYLSHYGLMRPEDRAKKVERYKVYDPTARFKDKVYYDDLERELEMRPFDGEALLKQLAASVDCQPRKTPTLTNQQGEAMNYIYLRRKKDGKIIDIPERDLEATMKTGNFERAGEVNMDHVIEPPLLNQSPVCPLCGWEAASDASLRMHKTKKHA